MQAFQLSHSFEWWAVDNGGGIGLFTKAVDYLLGTICVFAF